MKYLMLFVILIAGCATNTGNPSADRRGRVTNAVLGEISRAVGNAAVSSIKNAATDQISGRKVDFAQSASEGLWSSMGTVVTSDSIRRIINAYGGGEIPAVAEVASGEVGDLEKAIGRLTKEEGSKVLSVIAGAISKEANK